MISEFRWRCSNTEQRHTLTKLELEMITDISQSLEAVEAALKAYPRDTITGERINRVIRTAAPELNFREIVGIPSGPGALTQFINSYLSDVLERAGNQGGDSLYRIVGQMAASVGEGLPAIWKTLVSPNSPNIVVLKPDQMQLEVRAKPANIEDKEIEISSVTLAEHNEIRTKFESELPADEAGAIRQLNETHKNFYNWSDALYQDMPTVAGRWGYFRRNQLLELLFSRITALELADDNQQILISQIEASQNSAFELNKTFKRTAPAVTDQEVSLPPREYDTTTPVDRAGRLARFAVEAMAYDDLRAMKIPLGAILDAMQDEN